MTQPEPPASARWQEVPPAPSLGEDLGRAVPVALRRGFTVSVVAVVLGQLPALLVNLGGGGLAVATQLRVGWLYTTASNVASIQIESISESTSASDPAPYAVTTIRLALLTFTGILVWMLVRAGAASARRVTDRPARRVVAGALVALPYALPLVVLAMVVELRLATGGGFFPDVTTLSAARVDMLIIPLSLGLAAGALGGVQTSAAWQGRVGTAAASGWRMFTTAMLASLVGLLLFAALRPSGLDGYVQELRSLGVRVGSMVVGHQALMLPNQAALALAPALGTCDQVVIDGSTSDALCLDRLPIDRDPASWLLAALDDEPGAPTMPAPGSTRLFLLVPLLAVVIGARRAAQGRSGPAAAAGSAIGATIVFGALVVAITWASSVTIVTADHDRAASADQRTASLGAPPLVAGAAAVGWGVVVGVPTACVTVIVRARRVKAGS